MTSERPAALNYMHKPLHQVCRNVWKQQFKAALKKSNFCSSTTFTVPEDAIDVGEALPYVRFGHPRTPAVSSLKTLQCLCSSSPEILRSRHFAAFSPQPDDKVARFICIYLALAAYCHFILLNSHCTGLNFRLSVHSASLIMKESFLFYWF